MDEIYSRNKAPLHFKSAKYWEQELFDLTLIVFIFRNIILRRRTKKWPVSFLSKTNFRDNYEKMEILLLKRGIFVLFSKKCNLQSNITFFERER